MSEEPIFNTVEIREIEIEILSIIEENDRRWCSDNAYIETVKHLLSVRKRVLDSKFVMDENYKSLLSDFNEALIAQATEMRKRVIDLHSASINCGIKCDIETAGKCFLGYKYSSIHPVQTMRVHIPEHTRSLFQLSWIREASDSVFFRSISVHSYRFFSYLCTGINHKTSTRMAGTIKEMSLIKTDY